MRLSWGLHGPGRASGGFQTPAWVRRSHQNTCQMLQHHIKQATLVFVHHGRTAAEPQQSCDSLNWMCDTTGQSCEASATSFCVSHTKSRDGTAKGLAYSLSQCSHLHAFSPDDFDQLQLPKKRESLAKTVLKRISRPSHPGYGHLPKKTSDPPQKRPEL